MTLTSTRPTRCRAARLMFLTGTSTTWAPLRPIRTLLQTSHRMALTLMGNKLYVTYFSLVSSAGILDVCVLPTNPTRPRCRRLFADFSTFADSRLPLWHRSRAAQLRRASAKNRFQLDQADHAFNQDTGHLVGTLLLSNGAPFSVPGLWDLGFGSGMAGNGATNQLFFSAGPCPPGSGTCPVQLYGDGLFGVIAPGGWALADCGTLGDAGTYREWPSQGSAHSRFSNEWGFSALRDEASGWTIAPGCAHTSCFCLSGRSV